MDSCWFVLTRVGLVLARVRFVLIRVYSCWYSCIRKDLIKTQSKKKDVLVIFISVLHNPLYYCKKRRTPIYLIKTVLKRNLKRTLFHNSTWRKLTWMNRNWTGKLQVTLLSTCISRKKLCSQTFRASSEEVILMYSEKMKSKCMKKSAWKSFFR